MKKSIIAIVAVLMLVSVLAIGLTACNNDEKNTNSLLFGKELLPLTAQIDTLTQLNNGSADIAVMDSIMAGYYTSRGDLPENEHPPRTYAQRRRLWHWREIYKQSIDE